MSYPVKSVKKLIEVALPLDVINAASAREKSIRHGHPSTLHLWWARRPLAAARAVIFAQLVNDPSGKWELENPGKLPPNHLKASWAAKRKQLFSIIEDLVVWENTTNEEVLEKARNEINKSWRDVCELNKDHPDAHELFNPDLLPALHDPFSGGGTIPLEAQRLGLEAYASDLNPVAVLINKAMIEFPPKFSGQTPIGPIQYGKAAPTFQDKWTGSTGLAEDVRRYGAWMKNEAQKRIGKMYPAIEITEAMAKNRPDLDVLVGEKLTVIASIWARTVYSPNPIYRHVKVPLVSTFILSNKPGKEAYIEPEINGDNYKFTVKTGRIPLELETGTSAGKRAAFLCLLSHAPIDYAYLREEGKANRLGAKLMAIVAEGKKGRVYLDPTEQYERSIELFQTTWKPTTETYGKCRVNVGGYGLTTWDKLFTTRQLISLTTFSELVIEAIDKIHSDALLAGMPDDGKGLDEGGIGALGYAQAIGVYLAFAVDKGANYWSSLCSWHSGRDTITSTFGRQALPMIWDFAEANPFSDSSGNFMAGIEQAAKFLEKAPLPVQATAIQADAQTQEISYRKIISTDPPYYDNIDYADLSDFFYVWLRRTMKPIFPSLFSTLAVPKAEELVATPYRHKTKEQAEAFFLDGMTTAIHNLCVHSHPEMPVTVYYAFKQSETESTGGTASTGWETFLEAVFQAGFMLTGTWPMRTEYTGNLKKEMNALASSIVLVCRRRPDDAPIASRREFVRELNTVLPDALEEMIHGTDTGKSPVAPVDLSQAVIGPGMGVFSKYSAILEADGSKMSVRTALQLINKYFLENDFDPETQWCLKWFEQNGWKEGVFGQADDLSRALGTSVDAVAETGVIESGGGKVRLLRPTEYPTDWDPKKDKHIPIWETLHHLIRSLRTDGETQTGRLLGAVKSQIEGVRLLAFRLYTLCERAGWADDARTYNELMTSWTAVETAAGQVKMADRQGELF